VGSRTDSLLGSFDGFDALRHERPYWRRGLVVAGVDEVGRGCLAGPVVAAAVILPDDVELPEVTDSKALTDAQRREQVDLILRQACSVGVGIRSARRIDQTNILRQTLEAMMTAVNRLSPHPDVLFIDGNQKIPMAIEQRPLIKGDVLSLSIAAASIVAKVTRDDLMLRLHERYRYYGWDRNKGYGTPDHLAALREHGPCVLHRYSFRGVRPEDA